MKLFSARASSPAPVAARRLTIAVVAALALVATSARQPGLSAQSSGVQGERAASVRADARSIAELMAIEAADTSGDLAQLPPGADLTFGSTFVAATLADTSAVPADGSLAAGPTQLLVVANGRIRTLLKSTGAADGVLNLKPNAFFTTARAASNVFGGRVKFDRWLGRWFVTMATDAVPGRVVIASSNTATLTASTVWSFASFDNTFNTSTCAIDAPTLGVDSAALYIGVNQFCAGAYAGTSAFVVRKTSAIGGAALVVTAFHNLTGTPGGAGPFAPQGADNQESAALSGYFIGVDNASFGTLMLRRVTDPAGTPTLSANVSLAVAATRSPVLVPHLGNTGGADGRLSANDDRLSAVSVRNGRLWATQAVGVTETGAAGTTRNGVRWYEIGGIDGTPSLVQSGAVHSTTGPGSLDERNYFNPSIAVTGQGRAALGFNTAGTFEYVNAAAAERLSSDAAGALGAAQLYTTSTSAYNPPLDPGAAQGRRWGRYSETVTDGCDDMTVWTLLAYTDTPNSYALQGARLRAPAPPVPISVSPASIAGSRTSVDLTVTASGAGSFFTPATGFGCRMSASIPGVTVNSVTQTGANTVVLNVSTVGAAPGAKTITVINPDGQAATSGSTIFSVNPGPAMGIDMPASGATAGQPLVVRGWAIDGGGSSGTGVDAVHVYAQPASGSPVLLGVATYGLARPDVSQLYGARFANSGFSLRAPFVLPAGPYTIILYAHSTVTGAYDGSSVGVTLAAPTAPVGFLDTPAEGATVAGGVGLTGWAVDAAGIRDVSIYRDSAPGEPAGLVFIGFGDFVKGARPDVQAAFPNMLDSDTAGWGMQILTNMLPGRGNGPFTFSAYATNHAGLSTLIGTRHVTVNNSASALPFGTIDTPGQGETVSGMVVNFGWVLTPSPLGIPVDGSTINVYIDGVAVGHPVYNQYRPDIATLFPGYFNSNGAVGYFYIDTTLLADGLHSIAWGVVDSAGQANGIGSRYFRVKNGS